jgi:hypothetical protein
MPSQINNNGFSPSLGRTSSGGKLTVGLDDHGQGFFQVEARFGKRAPLCVYTGDFFHVGHVPLATLFDH